MTSPQLRWKTRAFAAFVILSNSFGNLFLAMGMHQSEEVSSVMSVLAAIFNPLVMAITASWSGITRQNCPKAPSPR